MKIQRKADRDLALKGLLTGVNPRQSDYPSIQRLVAAGETNLELQRKAIEQTLTPQALPLARDEANVTQANPEISGKIKTKLGAGSPLPAKYIGSSR